MPIKNDCQHTPTVPVYVWTLVAWMGLSSCCFAQPAQDVRNVFLPAPRDLKQLLTRARKSLDQQEYSDAVIQLGTLLTSKKLNNGQENGTESQDFFIGTPGEQGTQTSLKAEAQRLLGTMPKQGRDLYELQFGTDARVLLDQAIKAGDARQLTEVTRQYFHTQAGYEATILLGRYELDHGRPLAAALCFKRVAEAPGALAQFDPELSLLLATAWLHAELPEHAQQTLVQLKKRQPDAKLRVGTRQVQLFQNSNEAVAWLRNTVGVQFQAAGAGAMQWVMFRGNAARTASMRGGLPLAFLRWQVPTANDASDEQYIEQLTKQYQDDNLAALPSLHPLVVDDVVLMRTPQRLIAVDFNSGKRIWEFPWFDTPDEEALQDSRVQNRGSGSTTRLIELTQRLWDDASYGQLSSDGQRVFVLWDLGYAKSTISSNVLIRPGGIQTRPPGAPKPYNRLASLDLKTQGSLQWIVGGVDGEDEPRLAGAFFLGPPLPLNGQLYVLAEVKGEIRLVVLDTRTGQLRWTQQLAHVDTRTITLDSTRRLAGATPSFSDGVLVCPTSAGAVVAVDISTRSLLWGYQYQQQAPVNARFGFRPSTTRSKKRNGERWADASVTIAQGKVLVTPVEGDDLICLDLLTGKSSWPTQKRDTRLYVACVHDGKVVMVGKESITAFTLADGKPAWSEPITLKKGMPSGRGFQSDNFYYLPTTGKQLLKIDLAKGEILQEITTSTVLGNLVCYRDEVISQTPRNLETYLQAARLREKVAARLEKDPQDSWALARRCELLLQDGKRLEALDSLRKCYQLDPTDIAMRSLLIDTILDLLREDFTTHQGLIDEAHGLVEQPAERESLLQLLALGLQDSGDLEGAFQTYMSLWTLDLQSNAMPQNERPLEKVSEDLHVRRDRWIQARIMQLLAKAEPAQRAKMEKTIQAHYDEAVASAKTQPLRNFIGFFGSHALAEQAQLQLASQLIHADQIIDRELLEAELYLVRLKRSANESVVAGATARLARLLKLARRYDEAVPYYIELADRWPDTVVIDDQTGQQLRDQAGQTPELKDLLAAAPRWPLGKTVVKENAGPRGQFPSYQRVYHVRLDAQRGPLPAGTRIAFDQTRNSIMITDPLGKTLQRISMADGKRFYSTNYSVMHAKIEGHLILLTIGYDVLAIDMLRGSSDPNEAILWRDHLVRANPNSRSSTPLRTRSSMNPWGGRSYVAIDSAGNQIGITGSVNAQGIYYQKMNQLICADPITGKPIWTRDNMAPGSGIYSDDQHVLVVSSRNDATQLLNATDGTLVETRPSKPGETLWKSLGTNALMYTAAGNKITLSYRNLMSDKDLWKKEFPVGTRGLLMENSELAVFQPDGKFRVLNITDGKVKLESQCEAEPQLLEIQVIASQDQYLLITNRSANSSGVTIPSMGVQSKMITGNIYAFDRSNGKSLWPVPATVSRWALPLNQPGDSPVLVFVRELHQKSSVRTTRSSVNSEFFCLDKRDGRLLMAEKKVTGYIRSFAVIADPSQQQVTVMINGQLHLFQFTDERLPPAAPVQMSQFTKPTGSSRPNPFNQRPPIRAGGQRIILPAVPKRAVPAP